MSTGRAEVVALPEPLPPGTASAIAMAMQPPVYRPPMQMPQVVNNTLWMHQWEAEQRQNALAAHFAMQSTMPKFNPALLINAAN